MRAGDEEDDDETCRSPAGHRLTSIINNLTKNRHRTDCNPGSENASLYTGDTGTNGEETLKPRKRPRMNGTREEYNNNHPAAGNHNPQGSPGGVKSERLSPGTPDTLSRSRSVTPSSASYPGTPPAAEVHPAMTIGRNYSDFMRSLAAKYNNANPNDYFGGSIRNGYPLLKPSLDVQGSLSPKPKPSNPDISIAAALLNPFSTPSPFPPLIDMSSTHALLAMVRSAKEAEVQGLLKTNNKRPQQDVTQQQQQQQQQSAALDLSAAAVTSGVLGGGVTVGLTPDGKGIKRARKEDKKEHLHEGVDISSWTVDDVCCFVSSIDICAEYAQKFREQRIDGAGLPLLTEEHLTTTMGLKLGPALKLRSLLARKTGSCSVCLHCVHCHSAASSPTTSSPGAEHSIGESSNPGAT